MTTTIRASSLTDWADCPRRTIARAHRGLVADAGFTLRPRAHSLAASIGTAVHAGFAASLGTGTDAYDAAETALNTALAVETVEYDQTCANKAEAERQTFRMVKLLRKTIVPHVRPVVIEKQLVAAVSDGYELSGHADVITERGVLDLKTTVHTTPPWAAAQLGAYGKLTDLSGLLRQPVERLSAVTVRRRHSSKPMEPAMITQHDPVAVMALAKRTLDAYYWKIRDFMRDEDPEVFPPNGNSILCSARWCPAWGTDFCKFGRGA